MNPDTPMESLRWILLVAGAVILLAVYLWSRRPRRSAERREPAATPTHDLSAQTADHVAQAEVMPEPLDIGDLNGLGDELAHLESMIATEPVTASPAVGTPAGDDATVSGAAEAADPAAQPVRPTAAASSTVEEKIIVMFVVASEGLAFPGTTLYRAMEQQGLTHGAMDIYHRLPPDRPDAEPVFSIANMVEPGTFKPNSTAYFSTPGITLFMRLPGPMEASVVFENMLSTAERIAETLGGEVLDSTRSSMSKQTAQHLRDEVRAWQQHNTHFDTGAGRA